MTRQMGSTRNPGSAGVSWQVIQGDAVERLRELPEQSIQTCITSPPYFGLRDYGVDGQIGLEPTPDEYVARLVEVFREVRRVLRDDGTLWLNLGDSYAAQGGGKAEGQYVEKRVSGATWQSPRVPPTGLKPKDLIGIPWLAAFALRADGWYLRSEIIWAKPNPMPESVKDRPTRSHEQVFMLSKGPRYYWDADAVREASEHVYAVGHETDGYSIASGRNDGTPHRAGIGFGVGDAGRNKRSVWQIATQPLPAAHFATFPPKLVEPMVLAGSSPRACGECGAPWERVVERKGAEVLSSASEYGHGAGRNDGGRSMLVGAESKTIGWQPTCTHNNDTGSSVVLDPFAGAGTTGLVALRHDRSFIGIELNADYCELARNRIRDDQPLLNSPAEAA